MGQVAWAWIPSLACGIEATPQHSPTLVSSPVGWEHQGGFVPESVGKLQYSPGTKSQEMFSAVLMWALRSPREEGSVVEVPDLRAQTA